MVGGEGQEPGPAARADREGPAPGSVVRRVALDAAAGLLRGGGRPGVNAGAVGRQATPGGPVAEPFDRLAGRLGDRDDAGVVTFRHYGVNQDDKQVFQGDRRMLIKRRSHWADK